MIIAIYIEEKEEINFIKSQMGKSLRSLWSGNTQAQRGYFCAQSVFVRNVDQMCPGREKCRIFILSLSSQEALGPLLSLVGRLKVWRQDKLLTIN